MCVPATHGVHMQVVAKGSPNAALTVRFLEAEEEEGEQAIKTDPRAVISRY